MTDRKPIFIVVTPPISNEHLGLIKRDALTKIGNDYHVFVVEGEAWEFKLYSDTEIEPIKLEQLKEELELTEAN